MKSNKTASRVLAILMISVMCFTVFSVSAVAVSLDNRGSISLTALDKDSKQPISGAVFRVYHIASAYTKGDSIAYIYTDAFKDNGMDMGNFSDAYLPAHLAVYAGINNISYTEKATDSTGRVVFDNLPCGAYLVVPVKVAEGYLNPTPFIIAIPMKDETDNKWIYNIDATPKIEGEEDETDGKTYISVKKLWKSLEKTPDSITVSLVKDGTVVDTVTLSAVNNWYYRWDNLEKNHSWNVIETNVPDGYTVSYLTSEMTVVITNTDDDYDDETTTSSDDTTTTASTTSTDDDTTTTDTTSTSDGTTTTDVTFADDDTTTTTDTTSSGDGTTTTTGTTKPTGTTQSTTKPEELIDTGQLNWPIPVLMIIGVLLIALGIVVMKRKKEKDHA